MSILVDRIEKYQEPADIKTMPIAYNELGTSLMRIPDKEEAVKSFIMSCEILEETTGPDDLPFPFPWMHRALIDADPDAAATSLLPVIKKRANKLGKDDTKTIE